MKKHIRKLRGLSYGNNIYYVDWTINDQMFLQVNSFGTDFRSRDFEDRADDTIYTIFVEEPEDVYSNSSKANQI